VNETGRGRRASLRRSPSGFIQKRGDRGVEADEMHNLLSAIVPVPEGNLTTRSCPIKWCWV
jgi:hypothetical protein